VTPPYKDTEGVEFASNSLQIEIRNVCRLFLFIVRKETAIELEYCFVTLDMEN
jgi:hypothetical protein